MNILYCISTLSRECGGTYHYSISLLKSLASSKDTFSCNFYVYCRYKNKDINELAARYNNIKIIPLKIQKRNHAIYYFFRKVNPNLNRLFRKLGLNIKLPLPSPLNYIIKKYRIDIVHSPHPGLPQNLKIPSIVTMHDVQELHYPEFFSSEKRLKRAIKYKYAIDNASAVVVSVAHVKRDIVKFFNKPESSIYVCLYNVKDLWVNEFNEKDIVNLEKYGVSDNFILYPAVTWEHKNHLKLIEAIYYLKKEKKIKTELICTGYKTDFYKIIQSKITKLGLQSQIKFLGVVPNRVLYSLYKKAKGVVIPTLYEAESIPLMECLILNVPVVCSNVTSLPATMGNDEFLFNPNDYLDIANKIYLLLTDKKYRIRNINNCKKRAEELKNINVAQKINNIYRSLLKKQRRS